MWRSDRFVTKDETYGPQAGGEVALFVDTFNGTFEREKDRRGAARSSSPAATAFTCRTATGRPLCCGRTFLAAGLVDEARFEASRSIAALTPFADRGVPIIGLEPSCLLTFRDEATAMRLGESANKVAASALLFEEFVAHEADAGRFQLKLAPIGGRAFVARPLPSEEFRRHACDGARAAPHSRSGG